MTLFIEAMPVPVFLKDVNGYYTGCNKAFENIFGKSRSEIIGKTAYDLWEKKFADECTKIDRCLFNHPGKQRYEWKVLSGDSPPKDLLFDKTTLSDASGKVMGVVGVISDITKQKHPESLTPNLSQMLIQAQERERQMISCELHDSIAQNLSTLKLYCSRLFHDPLSVCENIKSHMTDISRLIDKTITDVRDLAYDLRPPSLDHLGLVHALKIFCEEFSEKNNIHVDFQVAGMQGLPLLSDMEINLYRLVHEGLNNIRKHAAATRAVIRLTGAYPYIILKIEDNGRGFDVKKQERAMIHEKRMGIWSMKERVNLLQGEMNIYSQLNRGTKMTIMLRLGERKNGPEKETDHHH